MIVVSKYHIIYKVLLLIESATHAQCVRVCVCACVRVRACVRIGLSTCMDIPGRHWKHRNFPECLHQSFHRLSIVALASADALLKLPSTILHLNGPMVTVALYIPTVRLVSPHSTPVTRSLHFSLAFSDDNRGWSPY